MEIMGLHLPGASFVNPNTPLRDALTELGAKRALELTAKGNAFTPIGHVIDERAVVNGVVGLHATGGSTNLTIHLIAMAAAAGIELTWDDFADLAEVTPLLTRIYPNGKADVNHFQAAGGMPVLIRELLSDGLLHGDARTVWGDGLADYVGRADARGRRRGLAAGTTEKSHDEAVLRGAANPFQKTGRIARARGTARPRGDQDLRRGAGAACDRGAGAGVSRAGRGAGGVQGGRAQPRRHIGGALPGAARERHARAAQADAADRRVAGPRPQGRAGDRRASVGRLGQGAGGAACHARGGGGRRDREEFATAT